MNTKRVAAIVYGVYINPQVDWKDFIREQLADLCATGVLAVADLHVVVSNPFGVAGVEAFFVALDVPCRRILVHAKNKYEFWAISYVWHLAQGRAGYRYVAYLHTKSMSYANKRRCKVEAVLTYFTFSSWRKALEIFETQKDINKIGLFPAHDRDDWGGWMWFNFWWAKAEYIRGLQKPRQGMERFYYEHWLSLTGGSRGAPLDDSYSLYTMSKARVSASDTRPAVSALRHRLSYRAVRARGAVRKALRVSVGWSLDRVGMNPGSDAVPSQGWMQALRARFATLAPRRHRTPVAPYGIAKRA
jgi:hypothetical protein